MVSRHRASEFQRDGRNGRRDVQRIGGRTAGRRTAVRRHQASLNRPGRGELARSLGWIGPAVNQRAQGDEHDLDGRRFRNPLWGRRLDSPDQYFGGRSQILSTLSAVICQVVFNATAF